MFRVGAGWLIQVVDIQQQAKVVRMVRRQLR